MFFVFFSFVFPLKVWAAVLSPGNISSCGELASPGLYTLTQSVSNGTTTCFTVSSDNVVINGGGFTVSGSGASSVAIDARARDAGPGSSLTEGSNGYTNLIINSLNITGYGTGINLSGNSDVSGSGIKNGNGGDGGDLASFYSLIGSINTDGGNSTSKTYGGIGGNISFTHLNLDISSSTISAIGGMGTVGKNSDGGLDLNYTGTLTKTNLVLSSLSFFNDNSTHYGVYAGGTWPILPGNISTCGTLYGPGTFTLTQSISGITGTCFTAATNDVVLNGAGYTITSATTTNTSYAANGANFSNFTFASTTVTNFSNLITSSSTITVSGTTLNLTSKKINSPNITIQSGTLNVASTTFVSNILNINYSTSITGTSTASTTNALSSLIINYANYGPRSAGLLFSGDWTARATDTTRDWRAITYSADGSRLVAAANNGYIYMSLDGGMTWATSTSSGIRTWRSIASSYDGTKLAAVVYNGYIYTSVDSGATWVQKTSDTARYWSSIASSADGLKLIAAVQGGDYIYTSADGGNTWTQQVSLGSQDWRSVASSYDGTKLTAVAWNNYVYISTDSGATWVQRSSESRKYWMAVSSSGDGTNLFAGASYPGYICSYLYTSTSSGATWVSQTSAGCRGWISTASDDSGTKLAAVDNGGNVYVSTDGGATWSSQSTSKNWYSIASDASGNKLAAVASVDYIYIPTIFSPTLSVNAFMPQPSSDVFTWNPSVSWSISRYCYYSYDNFTSTSTANCSLNGSDIASPPTTGNVTLYVKGISNTGTIVSKSINFNNYSNSNILISSPVLNLAYDSTSWFPNIKYSTTNANLTTCQYSYNNWTSTSTADCSKAGSDILAPSADGLNTLYVRTVDSGNNVNFLSTRFRYLYSFIERAFVARARYWYSIASSADGTKLAAVDEYASYSDSYIYTSTDSGVTWTAQLNSGSRYWSSIASSADGTKLAAVDSNNGYIYTSTTSGATWSTNGNSSGQHNWTSITSSSDGTKLVAVVSGNYIYTSTDSGATWFQRDSSRYWKSVASSADGTKLIAGVGYPAVACGYIYTSTSSGVTWTAQAAAGCRVWLSTASDSTGMKLAAVDNGGSIYTSTDGGATWTSRAAARNWYSITSDASGNKLAAVDNGGYVYTSDDGGATWFARVSAGSRNWQSVVFSADGTNLAAGVASGYIYTLKFQGNPSINIKSPTSGVYLNSSRWSPSVNWGLDKSACYYSYNNFTSTSTATCTLGGSDILAPIVDGASTLYLKAVDLLSNVVTTSVNFIYNAGGWISGGPAATWRGVASDATGKKLFAVTWNGYIYKSIDSGITWSSLPSSGAHLWTSITSSADGTKLAASVSNGQIYISTDSGTTWTPQGPSGIWASVSSSADGTKLAAAISGGYVYTSVDSGVTWIQKTSDSTRTWYSVKMSADGTKIFSAVNGGYIYTSLDSGATWATSTAAGSRNWRVITSSADGTKVFASSWNDYIWTSTTSGATWAQVTSAGSNFWDTITSDASGNRIAVAVGDAAGPRNGYIYISTDGGATWNQTATSVGAKLWYSIASSADGTKLVAGDYSSGYIYSYASTTQAYAVNILTPQAIVVSWPPVVSWGSATSCYYSYNNFTSTSTADCSLYGTDISMPASSGTSTLYIKGINATGVTKTSSITFSYAPSYWCGTADSNWSNVSNWYTSNSCSVNTGALPISTSAAVLVGSVSPIISFSTTTLPSVIDSTGLTGAANTAGVIFANSVNNTTKIVGNATFNNTAYNTGTITGNAIFTTGSAGTFTLSNSMIWGGTISGTIKGGDGVDIIHLIFNNSSSNGAIIPSNISAVFNNSASNNGVINGNATFNNTGIFTMGTVNGTSTLNALSQTLNGINNVVNLVKTIATSVRDTLYLTAGSVLNVSGVTTILGYDANNLLTIRSTTSGVYASLGINGTANLNYLRLKDIYNTGTTLNLSTKTVFDDLGNSGFIFPSAVTPVGRNGITSLYTQGGDPLFPGVISSCGNIYFPGTYTLSGNITNASGTCFVIKSAGVTINGGGNILNGNLTADSYGVILSNINISGLVSTNGTTTINNGSHLTGGLITAGTIVGDNTGSVGSTTISTGGVILANAVTFTGDVVNNGVINSGNYVTGSIINNGTINGDFVMNASSINTGTVNGQLTLNESSTNVGVINGDFKFNTLTAVDGVVSFGSTTAFAGTGHVTGNTKDSGGNIITRWVFNDQSSNEGFTLGNSFFNSSSSNAGVVSGNSYFSGSSINAGTVTGNAYLSGSSRNTGTITGNADIFYNVATSSSGTVGGSITYHSYPNEAAFNNVAGDGLWSNEANWFTDTTFAIPLGRLPISNEDVTLFASTTLPSDVINNVFLAANNVTLNGAGYKLTGNVSGNGAYGGHKAYDFNLKNIVVIGTTTAIGGDGVSSDGGAGGTINIDTASTGGVVVNGGDPQHNGGDAGTSTISNSFAIVDGTKILAVGGASSGCGYGGSGGNISLVNSSGYVLVTATGEDATSTCDISSPPSPPSTSRSGGIVRQVGVYMSPEARAALAAATAAAAAASNNKTPGSSSGSIDPFFASLYNSNIGKLNLSNIPKIGLVGLSGDNLGVSNFVNPLNDLLKLKPIANFSNLPMIDFKPNYNNFLNSSMPKSLAVSINGRDVPTKLSIDKKGSVYQIITVAPDDTLLISAKNTDKTMPKATFNGVDIKTSKDKQSIIKLSVTAPKDAGVYTLKIGTLTLQVKVVSTQPQAPANPNPQTPVKKLSPIQKLWSWFVK